MNPQPRTSITPRSSGRRVLAASCVLVLAGCATTGRTPGDQKDPWESWNRKVFGFNESLDANVLRPVATAYQNVVPELVRDGIGNFYRNILDAWSAVNCLLQAKLQCGVYDTMRFGVNTFFGLGGVLDVASEMGIDRSTEDFGQTLGRWGVGSGPYVVWPLFGPSTVRDSFALPLDRMASPALALKDAGAQFGLTTLQVVNTRAELLGASRVLDDIALDKYTFIRDAYLTRRRSLISDGEDGDGGGSGGGGSDAPPPPPADAAPLPPPADSAASAATR